jgi:hypothetical protein
MRRNSGIIGAKISTTVSAASGTYDIFDQYNAKFFDRWPYAPSANISLSTTSLNETTNRTLTATVTTQGYPTGTTLFWTVNQVSGTVVSGDFTSGFTGSFSISGDQSSATGTITIIVASDEVVDGTDVFNVQVRTGSIAGPIVVTSQNVTIADTSTAPAPWTILMRVDGRKVGTINADLGSPGSSTFMTMTETSTGANNRNAIGNPVGLYTGFFNKTNITKIAFIDGSGTVNPTTNTNYLIYDLVESTGAESINAILKRLDIYQRDSAFFHNNDTVWPNPSVLNHTAGTNGYSGLLSASGGSGFTANSGGIPGRFCVMGINRDSDNDIQALCAFTGDLQTGKGDSWRGNDPAQTFWSYWGHDFHSNSQTQRIGSSLQTNPGVAAGASWTGPVYLVAF